MMVEGGPHSLIRCVPLCLATPKTRLLGTVEKVSHCSFFLLIPFMVFTDPVITKWRPPGTPTAPLKGYSNHFIGWRR